MIQEAAKEQREFLQFKVPARPVSTLLYVSSALK